MSLSSGVVAAEDFANRSQLSLWDSLLKGCQVQWKPPSLCFSYMHSYFLDEWEGINEWADGESPLLVELQKGLRIQD